MSSATTVSVNWGKASLADKPPVYADDGSAWSNGYRGVWHFRPMNEVGVLTDSSYYRNHALDDFGFTQPASVIGSGRSLSGEAKNSFACPLLIPSILFMRKATALPLGSGLKRNRSRSPPIQFLASDTS